MAQQTQAGAVNALDYPDELKHHYRAPTELPSFTKADIKVRAGTRAPRENRRSRR